VPSGARLQGKVRHCVVCMIHVELIEVSYLYHTVPWRFVLQCYDTVGCVM